MHAALMRIELHLPGVGSLKEKRRIVRPLVERIRRSVSASVSEVDRHDAWQRCRLGVALVAPDPRALERLLGSVRELVESDPQAVVLEVGISYLEDPDG